MKPLTSFSRSFITTVALLVASVPSWAAPVREQIELNDGWNFSMDGKNQVVSIPHSWNRVGYYKNQLMEDRSEFVNKVMGAAVYKREFSVDVANGKQVWLEFDGVSRIAEVYVNGGYVGKHEGPFTRFRFNITHLLNNNGKPNHLTVNVTNAKPTADSETGHVLPIAGDFFVAGGIYRSARIVITNDSHFAMKDYGSDGIYTQVISLSNNNAVLSINALIEAEGKARPSQMQLSLTNEEGTVVAEKTVQIKEHQHDLSTQLDIQEPKLWGVGEPYLYQLTAKLEHNHNVLDSVSFPVGLRTVKATNEGFFVNGQKVLIKGVGYHQDNYVNGWASNPEDTQRDFSMLTDMGINSIRLSHYPHGKTIHSLADNAGVLLWDEIPLVTFWNFGTEREDVMNALADNAVMQLREMVKQHYNHPSVVIWGIANEVDFAKAAPAFIGTTPENLGSPIPLLERLDAEVEHLDTRPSAIANCCQGVASMSPLALPEVMDVPDIIGANRYFGWYFGDVDDLSANLETLHKLNKPVAVTEYGAGGAVSLHSDNVEGGKIDAAGFAQPEEYMSYIHEKSWSIISSKPWILGGWIWNAFDFSTTIRNEGDSKDINTKGIITADRKIAKDAYYFYQANWSDKPVVHITSKRYKNRQYPIMDVKVYSNASSTVLSVNGTSLSARSSCENNVCEWKNIRLTSGKNQIVATGKFDDNLVSDNANFYLSADRKDTFLVNAGYIISRDDFGSDNFFDGGQGNGMDVHASWRNKAKIADITSSLPHDVVAHYREGTFNYRLPVTSGEYEVTLVFVEPDTEKKQGQRIFDVAVNNQLIVDDLDLMVAAKAPHTEYKVVHTVKADEQGLDIKFTPSVGEAVISALIVKPKKVH